MQPPVLTIHFLVSVLDSIKQFDYAVFTLVNSTLTNSFLDTVLPYTREALIWTPLYLFFLIFLFVNYGIKTWWYIVFVLIGVLLTDQIASHFFKPLVQRPRPCADEHLNIPVRLLLQHCAGGFSFMSSHAANHFGLATFVSMTMKPVLRKWTVALFIWAFMISYAQIYVGVHFPIDVFCGAILGYLIGLMLAKVYMKSTSLNIEF